MTTTHTGVTVAEFTRVELARRIAVLEGVLEAYGGHATLNEFEAAETNPQRRTDIIDLLVMLGTAANDVAEYAGKFTSQLADGGKIGDG